MGHGKRDFILFLFLMSLAYIRWVAFTLFSLLILLSPQLLGTLSLDDIIDQDTK
jgi:hypothetical protein